MDRFCFYILLILVAAGLVILLVFDQVAPSHALASQTEITDPHNLDEELLIKYEGCESKWQTCEERIQYLYSQLDDCYGGPVYICCEDVGAGRSEAL